MLSPLRNRFGIPGVISVIALAFAMLGGAYAASNTSGGKATVSKKAKQGKQGPRGKTGPAGPQGPAGPAGAKGDSGAAGSNGTNGTNGTDGTSATTAAIPTSSATCNHNGGVEVKSVSPVQNVCNGQTGFTETLPLGKTEMGAWSVVGSEEELFTSISFDIPLPEEFELSQIHYIASNGKELIANGNTGEEEELTQTVCTGDAAEPTADAGNLCVYESRAVGTVFFRGSNFISTPDEVLGPLPAAQPGAGVSGARIGIFNIGGATPQTQVWGSWAVTA